MAILLDALIGDPVWLYSRIPHPVVWAGRLIEQLEQRLLKPHQPPENQQLAGVLLVVLVAGTAALTGTAMSIVAAALPDGWLVEAVAIAILLAWRSLVDHVRAVAAALSEGLEPGRRAVARIVGRDPASLDAPAIGRAAIESLAENLSDGLAAPLFWATLLGLPGIAAYKAINTLDSMVGHKSPRYRHFGWASARVDDVVNFVPARLTGLAIVLAAAVLPGASPGDAWRALARDAPRHRSPNAGWPEAAMAGALGLRLAGPRQYGGLTVDDGWMGDGRAEVDSVDIERAIRLAALAYGLYAGLLLGIIALLAWW